MTTPNPMGESRDLGELRRLLAEASPAPWRLGTWAGSIPERHVVDMGAPPKAPFMMMLDAVGPMPVSGVIHSDGPREITEANAALIVALVNAAPELIASAERASRLEAALREMGFEFSRRSVNLANEGARLAYHEAEKMIHKALAATPGPK
jgi:hypothetical protein